MPNYQKQQKLPLVVKGGIYQHYKGAQYVVLFVGQDSNNDRNKERTVVYMSLTPPHCGAIRVRHLTEFCEDVDWPDLGWRAPRFVLVGSGDEGPVMGSQVPTEEEQSS